MQQIPNSEEFALGKIIFERILNLLMRDATIVCVSHCFISLPKFCRHYGGRLLFDADSPCLYAYNPMSLFIKKKITGTRREGSIFNVLQSLIFKIEIPELKIKKPPTIEISVNKSFFKNPDKSPAPK